MTLIIVCLFGIPASVVAQSHVTLEHVTRNLSGRVIEIPGSRSPNGKLSIFSVNLDGTTGAVAAIVTTDLNRCLAVSSAHPYGSNIRDRKPKSYLTVLWSNDSRYVAIHDSILKHSRLEVFVCDESGGRQIDLPDLLEVMIAKGIIPPEPASSGQEPIEWIDDKHLLVEVRAKTKLGEVVSGQVTLEMEQSATVVETSPKE